MSGIYFKILPPTNSGGGRGIDKVQIMLIVIEVGYWGSFMHVRKFCFSKVFCFKQL